MKKKTVILLMLVSFLFGYLCVAVPSGFFWAETLEITQFTASGDLAADEISVESTYFSNFMINTLFAPLSLVWGGQNARDGNVEVKSKVQTIILGDMDD